jgi:hypothetical protein
MDLKKFIFLCPFIVFTTLSFAYNERNLLEKAADISKLKEIIIIDQKWVPYPDYADRAGWDKLLGDNKQGIIKKGEYYLNYKWQIIKATDYLEFNRRGNRTIMENPYFSNQGHYAIW